jgi:AmmeMemoRadiSam system protein B
MRVTAVMIVVLLCAAVTGGSVLAQAVLAPAQTAPPTLEEVRKGMGIPSTGADVRGQQDAVGFASRADQMKAVWDLSAGAPPPERLGDAPPAGVAGAICPHDDYLYAGRVYRQVVPLVTAKRVVLVGVFHRYRKFGAHDRIVFDTYRAWRAPDGEIPVSALRGELVAALPDGDRLQDAAMHDSEHSLEALAYWLKHARPDVEIVPIIVPAASFARLDAIAGRLGDALAAALRAHGWRLGSDVAVMISSDAVHYGPDFKYVPYGDGGVDAYLKATERDRALLRGPLAGPVTTEKVRDLYGTFVDPADPDTYRLTWCGRFAVPFGLLLLEHVAQALGTGAPVGHPLAYATSVGSPELPVRELGLGPTAPANLYHFVGYPAAAYTLP